MKATQHKRYPVSTSLAQTHFYQPHDGHGVQIRRLPLVPNASIMHEALSQALLGKAIDSGLRGGFAPHESLSVGHREMKIRPTDSHAFFELTPYESDGVSFLKVEASFGKFRGRNSYVSVERFDEFISQFVQFILDRSLTPLLSGTYNFGLRFFAGARTGIVRVRCSLGTIEPHPDGNREYRVHGEFEINQEYLVAYLREFRELREALM